MPRLRSGRTGPLPLRRENRDGASSSSRPQTARQRRSPRSPTRSQAQEWALAHCSTSCHHLRAADFGKEADERCGCAEHVCEVACPCDHADGHAAITIRTHHDLEYTVTRSDDSLVVARSHEVHVLHRFQKRNISAVGPTPYSQSRTQPLRLREDRECRVHPNNHVIMFIDRHSSPIRGRCILECGRPAQRTIHEILKIDQVQRAPGRDVSLPSYPALRYGVQGTSADIAYLTVNLVRLSSVIVFHMTT